MVYATYDNTQNCLLYISKSYYPSEKEFEEGVSAGLLNWERKDPNLKILDNRYKEEVARKIEEEKVFEVLLVNNAGDITEGSRSNAFFIKGTRVYTAPERYVLKGITRQYVIEACISSGFEVVEELIGANHLNSVEGLFISGTSIKVLPVSKVDDVKFDSGSNPTIIAIRERFDRMIEEYVKARK
jgi:branched-chain amino acid aminotransferase